MRILSSDTAGISKLRDKYMLCKVPVSHITSANAFYP